MKYLTTGIICAVAISVTGCDSSSDSSEVELLTGTVPAKPHYFDPADYMPPGPALGAIVRFEEDSAVAWWAVNGFEHEFGTYYEITVEYSTVYNESLDSMVPVYELVSIDESQQDPIGTVYTYEEVNLAVNPFFYLDGVLQFDGYSILCADDVPCGALVEMGDSGGLIEVQLTLTGGDIPVTLTYWQ